MVIEQQFSAHHGEHYYGVTGTDVSLAALGAARRGEFHRRKLVALEPDLLGCYFSRVDDDHYQICERLGNRMCFMRINFLEPLSPTLDGMDVIFCQNVLVYFSRQLRADILSRMAECLSPGGLLVLGSGEILQWSHPDMERVPYEDTVAYYRPAS